MLDYKYIFTRSITCLLFLNILSACTNLGPGISTETPSVFYREVTPVKTEVFPTSTTSPFYAGLPTLTPFTPSNAHPLIQLAWFDRPDSNHDAETLAEDFKFYILTRTDEPYREKIKSYGANTPFYMYMGFQSIHAPKSCSDQPWLNQAAYVIGDFCNISSNHPDWFLTDTSGQRMSTIWESERFYYMDPTNVDWQNFFIDRISQAQKRYGWNGIFLDNFDASLGRFQLEGFHPAKFPDDASLQDAYLNFVVNLRKKWAEPAGVPIYANVTYIHDPTVFYSYMNYLEGAMIENFAVDWTNYFSVSDWEKQLGYIEYVQKYGRGLILVGQGDVGDQQRETFALASYLLINNGKMYFRYSTSTDAIVLYDNYKVNLGKPKGMRYKKGDTWYRDFENGQVSVNPQTHNASITTKQ